MYRREAQSMFEGVETEMIPRGSRMGKIWPQKKKVMPEWSGTISQRKLDFFFFFPGIRGAKKRGIIERQGKKRRKETKDAAEPGRPLYKNASWIDCIQGVLGFLISISIQ